MAGAGDDLSLRTGANLIDLRVCAPSYWNPALDGSVTGSIAAMGFIGERSLEVRCNSRSGPPITSSVIVLVIGNRLRCLNAGALSIHYIRSKGLPIAGYVLNNVTRAKSPASLTTGRVASGACSPEATRPELLLPPHNLNVVFPVAIFARRRFWRVSYQA